MEFENLTEKLEFEVEVIMENPKGKGTKDYNELENKPTLNGVVIQGDMYEQDPTIFDWAKEPTKPTYSAMDVNAISVDDSIPLSDIQTMVDMIFT